MEENHKQLKTKWDLSVCAILSGGLAIFMMLLSFGAHTEKTMEQSIRVSMDEINQTAVLSLQRSFDGFVSLLEQQTKLFAMLDHPDDQEILATLVRFAGEEGYKNASIVTYDDKVYSSFRGIAQVKKEDRLPNLLKRGTIISQPRNFFDGTLVIDFSTPVVIDGDEVGKLVVSIDSDYINQMFPNRFFGGDSALNLMTQEGLVIARMSERPSSLTPQSNVFDFYSEEAMQFVEGDIDALRYAMSADSPLWVKYRHQGEMVGVSYVPFGINNWYMAIATTGATLYAQSTAVQQSVVVLTSCIMLVVVAAMVVVVLERVREQKRIDALKNTYSIALKKTNDLFYEADIDNDRFTDYSEQKDKTIWKDPPKNYSNALIQVANICAPECRQQFLDTFLPQNIRIKMREGISSINFEYKIKPDERTERWLSATFVPICDGDGTKLICMENDITEEKLKQEKLRRSAILDGLTGLCNRKTIEDSIGWFLQGEGREGEHALAIIDIDHFKEVNDVLGHPAGDVLLVEFATSLKRIFRKSDLIGRVGGDEFVVLLKDYGVEELVMAKMREVILDMKRSRCLVDDPDRTVETSASIGVAFYTKDGEDFATLYQAADIALYASKNAGRDRYTFYTPQLTREPSAAPS